MGFSDLFEYRALFFDGALGSLLPEYGLKPGNSPESFLYSNYEGMLQLHLAYINAGADVITANTFGANEVKLKNSGYDPAETVALALKAAGDARKHSGKKALIAVDIGPTGKLLEPLGELSFDAAYKAFSRLVIEAEKNGADIIIAETMTDTYEMKAAVLAARENTSLPLIATFSFDENGRLLTGGDVKTAVALLEGLGVDVLGVNCSFGPDKMEGIVDELLRYSSTPLIVQANAGLPKSVNGRIQYDVSPSDFAEYAKLFIEKGVSIIGGCCGTTPEYIAECVRLCGTIKPLRLLKKDCALISSFAQSLKYDDTLIISEKMPPASSAGSYDYLLNYAFEQQDRGVNIIDVDVGLHAAEGEQSMLAALAALQPVIALPLQISTTDVGVLEKALRYYNGKPLVNLHGMDEESLPEAYKLVKKYGGVLK